MFATLVDRPFLLSIVQRGWSGAVIREPLVWYRHHGDGDARHLAMTTDHVLRLFRTYRAALPKAWDKRDQALFYSYTGYWLFELYRLTPPANRPRCDGSCSTHGVKVSTIRVGAAASASARYGGRCSIGRRDFPVKVIALVPVRNEAWVLEHSLACWSGFCDVVIVSDQSSTDRSRDICRRFPKVVLLESTEAQTVGRLPQQARWRLLDAARQYDGNNLLWCTDADELTPPTLARKFLEKHADELTPRRVVECRFYNVWDGFASYRQDLSVYGPQWKPMGFVDDRHVDYPRSPDLRPLHEPRMPIDTDDAALKAEELPVLHLQFAIWNRNQMKQAWYRCIEWLDRRTSAAHINATYSVTLPEWYVHTEPVPRMAGGHHAAGRAC